jgi:coniferyl-aldehyde dehydrogenase
VHALHREAGARYGDLREAGDYTRIVNQAQFDRLHGMLDEARTRGAQVIELVALDSERARRERLFAPTLVLDPPTDSALMREEIFGPILPVATYATLDEALARVAHGERPLALYPFSHDARTIERILDRTLAGGVTVNDTLWHFGVHGLPFGGVGASGMGAIHGKAGFDTFTKQVPVLRQARRAATDWIRPPYRGKVDRLIRFLAR